MYCIECGKELGQNVNFCIHCGGAVPASLGTAGAHARALNANFPLWLFVAGGALIGAFIGYLNRPSAMLLGQLPFWTIITGGATLQGFDQMLVPLARQSLNEIMAVTMICTVLGGAAGLVLRTLSSKHPGTNA